MRKEKPVLVVGAGPAGSVCAWRLAREGVRVLLADRSSFPRPKLCGGALSGYGADLLVRCGMLLSIEVHDLASARHGIFSCFDDFRLLRTFCGKPEIRIVDRTFFDSFLYRRALEAGAEPLGEQEFTGFHPGGGAVFRSGLIVDFRRMVGADGANSTTRRRAYGKPRGSFGLCLETFVPLAPSVLERFAPLGFQAHFGLLPYGYGWVIPRLDDVCVGVGSFGSRSRPVEAAKALERLLEHLELGSRRNIQGAVVPTFRGSVLPGKGRVLLAGEAAGLCDRVSGEGIAHALESGLLAAEAILSGAGAWSAGARCVRQVKDSGFYRHLLYGRPFRKLAMKKLRESDRFQELYWRIIAGDSDYAVLLQRRRPMSFSAT